jgi:hypothetical protein
VNVTGIQAQRAALVAHAAQRSRRFVLDAQLLVQPTHGRELRRRGCITLEPRRDRVVGELGVIQDARPVDVGAGHRAVRADRHLDHHRQPLLGLVQRGEVGRELLGQHREDPAGRVDGGRIGARVVVDRRALGDESIDIGDRDQDLHRAAGERLGDAQLVQVA